MGIRVYGLPDEEARYGKSAWLSNAMRGSSREAGCHGNAFTPGRMLLLSSCLYGNPTPTLPTRTHKIMSITTDDNNQSWHRNGVAFWMVLPSLKSCGAL